MTAKVKLEIELEEDEMKEVVADYQRQLGGKSDFSFDEFLKHRVTIRNIKKWRNIKLPKLIQMESPSDGVWNWLEGDTHVTSR